VHSQPPSLFIIHKRERLSPDEVRPLEVYYLLNNRIQQSPDLYALISNRMNASLHALMSSMSMLRQHKPSFTPKNGHIWPVSFDSASAFVPSSSRKSVATTSGVEDGALHVADTPMDTGTPARSGSVTRGESTQSIVAAGIRAQIGGSSTNLVTFPLLQAIRTTAAHTLATSPLPSASTEGIIPPDDNAHSTRRIRSVMELVQASKDPSLVPVLPTSLPSPQQSQRMLAGPTSPEFPNTTSVSSPHVRTVPTPGPNDLRKISMPGTQVSSPNPPEAGTPGGLGGEKKKKRKRAAGPGGTPISAQSPSFPPPA